MLYLLFLVLFFFFPSSSFSHSELLTCDRASAIVSEEYDNKFQLTHEEGDYERKIVLPVLVKCEVIKVVQEDHSVDALFTIVHKVSTGRRFTRIIQMQCRVRMNLIPTKTTWKINSFKFGECVDQDIL
jgi:hypothetical protein